MNIKHYGVKERSGRYPFGSGGNAEQRGTSFLAYIDDLKKNGMTDVEISKSLGMSTTTLRAKRSLAKAEKRKADYSFALRLKDKGMSNVAIGERMGINESSVRSLLNPVIHEKNNITKATANMLMAEVDKKKYLDVGVGTECHLGISRTKLKTAIEDLKENGYKTSHVKVTQLGTGKQTDIMVLTKDDVPYSELYKDRFNIKTISNYSEDGGRSYLGIKPIHSVSSKDIKIRYAEEGGSDKDGVIELRRGVDNLSLGRAKYAQVRIGVDGTHYLKGMAVYSDNMPDGVNIVFNTNKSKDKSIKEVLKKMKVNKETGEIDTDNPFGATVRQRHYIDKNGEKKLSSLNIVNEEGDWSKWSKNLSSQMLSKQRPVIAKKQLGLAYDLKKQEYDDIMSLTNPSVKKILLDKFSDGADSAAVHLKAAALPRQASHVILPFPKMKETEIYAPGYRDGEQVVLIRYPHGGVFEIPELKVNNKYPVAKKLLGQAKDAVGINAKVAEQMSGADFDGDSVLVIPTRGINIKKSAPIKSLLEFDPKAAYPKYKGMPPINHEDMQIKMGKVSNLITDMTIKGASSSELARAVKHSMVIIDAEKHELNHKQSYKDNGIASLKAKYQGGPTKGASTIISRASSQQRVTYRKEAGIDPKTGKKLYKTIDESYVNKDGKTIKKTTKSTKMYETDDAHKLSSGVLIETIYADHANKMKALGNAARKESYNLKPLPYSPSAKKVYAKEVASLNAQLNLAYKNKPLERQAQLIANMTVNSKKQSNPDMSASDLKRLKGQALDEARTRVGANKTKIKISSREWEAIQAGAISGSKLGNILSNSDLDRVKELATPRTNRVMTKTKTTKAKQLLKSGYTQSEVADALGVSVSTINNLD